MDLTAAWIAEDMVSKLKGLQKISKLNHRWKKMEKTEYMT